jgi:hypothetical protein
MTGDDAHRNGFLTPVSGADGFLLIPPVIW